MDLVIGEIIEHSTIDYPGELVSVIPFCQCSFECPFCQNWRLVRMEDCETVSVKTIVQQMAHNKKFITGVCVTGGEPTLQIEGLTELLKQTRNLGLLNKIDTNGFFPKRLEKLLSSNLIDYVALDIKAPLIPEKYGRMIGKPKLGEEGVTRVKQTLELLANSTTQFETRTTVVPTINDTEEDIEQIVRKLKEFNVGRHILQQFLASGGTLREDFSKLPATDHDQLVKLGLIAKKFIPDIWIRTIEAGHEKI